MSHFPMDIIESLRSISRQTGLPIWLVGGTVRDWLLGRPAKDIDLIVPERAFEVGQHIADQLNGTYIPLFETVETARIVLRESKMIIDISNFRQKMLEADLFARDLTINAMALPLNGPFEPAQLIDPTNGHADLSRRQIRAVSKAALQADPVRILRAIRFTAMLGFHLEPQTQQWIAAEANRLIYPAMERITEEFFIILQHDKAHQYVDVMDKLGLVRVLLPECDRLRNIEQNNYHHTDVWAHTRLALAELEAILLSIDDLFPTHGEAVRHVLKQPMASTRCISDMLKFTMLLHDVGKATTQSKDADGIIHFYQHEKVGAHQSRAITKRFRLSNTETKFVQNVIRSHLRPLGLLAERDHLSRRAYHRYFRDTEKDGVVILLHALADISATRGKSNWQTRRQNLIDLIRQMLDYYYQPQPNPPLLNGTDLINAGVPPGAEIGRLLRQLAEEYAAGTITSREEALAFVKQAISPDATTTPHSDI
ncbi:MAG: CCA tRNA nucleotidyltransferase [Gemmatimonadetes bacterium]|nr:MAG: CCA tRNA nucleotidyltransferase [Gemmatimonadota bacterium]